MDLSDLDCPQYVNFPKEDCEMSCSSEDECLTRPQHLIHSQNSLLRSGKSYKENSHINCKVLETSLTVADLSDATINNISRSPLSNLDSLENSMEAFPVHQVFRFSAVDNVKHNKPRNVTQACEFNLTKGITKQKTNYLPLAEQVAAFHRKTPARFHTTRPKKYEPVEQWIPPVTNPKSPELQALKRHRTNTAVSREDREEKEIEEMKKYKFHAKPIPSSILKTPRIPERKKRPVTKPKDFKLKTAERAAEQNSLKEEDEKYEFHAMPVPKTILNGPTGLKAKNILPPTCAMSPAFALKEREQKWKAKNRSDNLIVAKEFHANPAPLSSSPFVVKHETKATEVQPFSFDKKDQQRYALKKRKIEEEIKAQCEVPQFKAQALPNAPNVESRLSRTPRRRNNCAENANNTVNVFKAQPATVLKKSPFVPKKAPAEVPDFKEFHFETEKRVEEWKKIKEQNHAKEIERQQLMLLQKAEEEKKEQEEIKKLRNELVHKANPVRTFKYVEIKHSDRPLTVPKSPDFATKKRL